LQHDRILGGGIKFEKAVSAVFVVVEGGGRDHFGVEDHAFRKEAE
jgi:hypothetical protein